ncbi:DUF6602 domain-containing protein [Chryseobacterium sp. JK1]|uniref:DUF6602 domain-containing protein n=1 Tax=Chryseobacterium sp. JK1 TaxID=874294 RepID=UPI003D68B7F1
MANRIFETVFDRKIENFASIFINDSESIFFNEENKLIHPGEYGKYRENALKDLLGYITKHKISDGFILTPENVSFQLDIVIYKNDEAPILEKNYIDFFSIESVVAIGEVKSTLNKSSFIDTLKKLARNKKLNEEKRGKCIKKEYKGSEHDELISFLVCKTTSFDINTLDFDEIYKGIETKYRHNFILDLEKGLIGSEFAYNNLNEIDAKLFIERNGNIDAISYYGYPIFTFNENLYDTQSVIHKTDPARKYDHIKLFLTQLASALNDKNLYSTEFVHYLGFPLSPIFRD